MNKSTHLKSEQRRWTRIQEAANYSGLTPQIIRNYARKGVLRLRHVRAPGSTKGPTLVDLRELDASIDAASAIPARIAVNSKPGVDQ